MSGHTVPGLVQARPLLEWLDDAFAAWDWSLDPGCFGLDVPRRITTPTALRRWLLATTTDYPTRDRVWAGVVTASRRGPHARDYRFLAMGLALAGLRNYRRRIHVHHAEDLPDVHADIAAGFLTRLAIIDTPSRNVAGRLIDSAIGYAARRHRGHQSRPLPADPGILTEVIAAPADDALTPDPPGIDPSAVHVQRHGGFDGAPGRALLEDLACRLRRRGVQVCARDLELIAVTRGAGRSLTEAAAELGIPAEVAYKRRRRAEQRLAALQQPGSPSVSRPGGG